MTEDDELIGKLSDECAALREQVEQLRRERDQARCHYAWEIVDERKQIPYEVTPLDFVVAALRDKYGLDEAEARRLAEESKR